MAGVKQVDEIDAVFLENMVFSNSPDDKAKVPGRLPEKRRQESWVQRSYSSIHKKYETQLK